MQGIRKELIMNKLIFLILLQFTLSYSQPLSSPSGMYVGLKVGVSHCVLDPGERFRHLSGKGVHGGIGIGLDIKPYLAINITPQIKTSSYLIGMWPGTDYHYTNLFIPAAVSLKLFSTQSTSPYLGIGGAVNFQLSGKKIDTDFGSEQRIEDLRNDLYLTICIGIKKKFTRLRISPEFSFNYNLTSNYPDFENLPVSNYDYCLTIGIGYVL
jgi:hypothetical protein